MYAGWALALLCGYYSFFGPSEISERGYQYQAHDSAIFGVLQPCLWSVCLCWCIYACYTGYGGNANSNYFFGANINKCIGDLQDC
jgi:hypothetical protein